MRSALLVFGLIGCGPSITETTMLKAAPREPACKLDLVQVDPTSMTMLQTWDILGYVTLHDHETPDPVSEENRARVRPRACAMGGTSIAIAMQTTAAGGGGGLVYMVLRPKEAMATPSTF